MGSPLAVRAWGRFKNSEAEDFLERGFFGGGYEYNTIQISGVLARPPAAHNFRHFEE
jgi:hypothetical protein